MKREIISRLIAGMLIVFGFGILRTAEAQDVVFSKEFTWTHPKNTYGGYGFYWWHRTDGVTRKDYGQLSPTDWTTPKNYYNGTFHMTFEVLDMPSKDPFLIQFGIWQKKLSAGHHNETVSPKKRITPGTKFSGSLGSPSSWWIHPEGNKVDFTRPEDFFRIGIVLWNANPVCIPMGKDWSSAGCPEYAARFFPMRVRVTITATPSGSAPPPTTPPPTTPPPTTPPTTPPTVSAPSYSIDYTNLRTKEKVSSEDQYSFQSDFSSVQGGNNAYLQLTPGQKVYFRKKADHSKKQTLDVPARPDAPSIGIDFALEKTNMVLNAEYQHSANEKMIGPTDGKGTRVNVTPGTKKYFRKKATASAFASKIQTLAMPERPAAPVYSIDYVAEKTVEPVAAGQEYARNGNMDGALEGADLPLGLEPGTDLYFRKRATTQAFASKLGSLMVVPRPVISSKETGMAQEASFTVNIEFMHGATNFTADDITAVNATLGAVTMLPASKSASGPNAENSTTYQVEVIGTGEGTISLEVKANAVEEGNFKSMPFEIEYGNNTTGLGNLDEGEMFSLYPNPSSGKVYMSSTLPVGTYVQLSLYSSTGRMVLQDEFPMEDKHLLNLDELGKGVYFIRISAEKYHETRKLIISR